MNIIGRKFGSNTKAVMLGLLYGLFVTAPAVADDIEIYTGSIPTASGAAVTANVLFIMDTSGSMDAIVTAAGGVYDNAIDYGALTAPLNCFDPNKLYVDVRLDGDGVPGYCGATPTYSIAGLTQFNDSISVCNRDNTALSDNGFRTDKYVQFRTGSWRVINNETDKIECRSDRNRHGEVAGPDDRASNQTASGFTSNWRKEINWGPFTAVTVYTGNYLNFLATDPPVGKTRLLIMQEALEAVIDTTSGINVGLMRFDDDSAGGMVVTPMGSVDDSTHTDAFKAELWDMYHEGGTPLSETLYEAAMYYQGKAVDYGNGSEAGYADPTPDAAKLSHPDSRTTGTLAGTQYESPIISECQKNYIVLLTDGAPWSDTDIDGSSARRAKLGMTGGCVGSGVLDNCLEDIAAAIGSNDMSASVVGDQYISTFTIGLELDHDLLKATAAASKAANPDGQGEYYIAEDSATLVDAFTKIVRSVLDTESTFSSPAVSVNAFNRATNLDDLYFTLFKPTLGEHWPGNFKKYKLAFNATTGDPEVQDQDGNPAINATTGFFDTGAKSFWTVGADDGVKTAEGGAAKMLTDVGQATPRKVYTLTGAYTETGSTGVMVPDVGLLSGPAVGANPNALIKGNLAVTEALLGLSSPTPIVGATPYRETLLDWAGGVDVLDVDGDLSTTDSIGIMGDPLHSEPALVQYGLTGIDADLDGFLDDPDLVAYVATNDGYLHAFNTLTGTEYFSFVPQELLPNLDTVFQNTGDNDKAYGIDGNVVPWINDANNDGDVSDTGEHVYIYFGMRRGGRDIYSMDVSDRNAPSLRWRIEGGTGNYTELGQTWSTINVEKINMGGTERTVLIFGGGYDTNQDTVTTRTADAMGRGVFIVDADTGALLWRAGPSSSGANLEHASMNYSIPARIKPIDINGDGYIDRLYTGDMGGQLWRFDIDNAANTTTTISATGGPIANLAADSSTTDARRFYYPPDVALIAQEGKPPFIAVVAGSGYRAHPLDDEIHDRMYMIRDFDVYTTPDYSTLTPIVESDLFDTTSNAIIEGASQSARDTALTSLTSAEGWLISLEQLDGTFVGEKALSEPLIVNGVAILTTFLPIAAEVVAGSCSPNEGIGALYFVNVADGTPTYDLSGNASLTREDRKKLLARGGIPPSPSVIITEEGTPTLCVGTECERAGSVGSLQKMYWYEK